MRSVLPKWLFRKNATKAIPDQQLLNANQNLKALLEDSSIPASVRAELSEEFDSIERISRKLREDEIHIAVFGRVSTGKSSLLNALLDEQLFSTSPLHGETKHRQEIRWQSISQGNVVLIDTPGIDELDGEAREQLAKDVAREADVLIMVCEGDLTQSEYAALESFAQQQRPLIVALNKIDRYTDQERALLEQRLQERLLELVDKQNILAIAADPKPETVIRVDADGKEQETTRVRPANIGALKDRLWNILEREGKTLSALNAALFASELDSKIASRIVEARRTVAERIIRNYCIGKGLAVAVNPIPVADLLAAAGTDIAMVIHLGEVYGFRLSRREATRLLLTIAAHLAALMGAYWGLNLVSAALKTVSAGLSTTVTAGAQGALAYYATYLTGRSAESWFAKGKSWGSAGPRDTVREIVASLDRDSILASAREDILKRLKA